MERSMTKDQAFAYALLNIRNEARTKAVMFYMRHGWWASIHHKNVVTAVGATSRLIRITEQG